MWRAPYIHEFWEGYYPYSSKVGEKFMPIFIGLMIYIGLVHDQFCLVLYSRETVKPMGGGHFQNVWSDSDITSS